MEQGWSKKDGQILTDEYGRPKPNKELYPSSAGGAGMRPLVDALAAKGLRLGLWIMRGVPRSAATARLPIFNTTTNSTALDAVRYDKSCFWSTSCYGSNYPAAAAAEYYASVAALFTQWGVQYLKARRDDALCAAPLLAKCCSAHRWANVRALCRRRTASFRTCPQAARSRTDTSTRT